MVSLYMTNGIICCRIEYSRNIGFAGTVREFIRTNPEVARLPILLGVAEGLQYLHGKPDRKSHNDSYMMSDVSKETCPRRFERRQ
jgi:hypothetical protein